MRQCKLIILIIIISFRIASGQKSEAYDVINSVYQDFLVVYYDTTIDHYYLLNRSYNFPSKTSNYAIQTNVINALTGFIPMEEILKMLSDSSSVGTIWKQKFLTKARVVNEKKLNELMGEKGMKEYSRKMEELEKKAETEPLYHNKEYYDHKYSNRCFKYSYPVFNTKRDYAIVYLTDDFWRGCIYCCHLVNGKVDKIVYQDCWNFEI
jgi:hypothetical protein